MPSLTLFSGSKYECPVDWLRSLSTAFPPNPAPRQWLERVNSCLCGEAALWAKQHLVTSRILSDENLKNATLEDVQMFKQAFRSRFIPDDDDMNDIDLQLLILQQTAFETLDAYYQRTESLLTAVLYDSDAVDSAGKVSTETEQSCLKRVIENFVRGIKDPKLQHEAVTYVRQHITKRDEYSLHAIYTHVKDHSLAPTTAPATPLTLLPTNHTNPSLPPSHPPSLTFSGLFGSCGSSHDSYTRSMYHHVSGKPRSPYPEDWLLISPRGGFTIPPHMSNAAREIFNPILSDDAAGSGGVEMLQTNNTTQKLIAMRLVWNAGIDAIQDGLKGAGTMDGGVVDTLSGVVAAMAVTGASGGAPVAEGSAPLSRATIADPSFTLGEDKKDGETPASGPVGFIPSTPTPAPPFTVSDPISTFRPSTAFVPNEPPLPPASFAAPIFTPSRPHPSAP